MPTTGLTLGKFAPLHKGHEYLIETALAQVDQLICLIYDSPEVTPVPLEVRSRWLRTRFPTMEVITLRGAPQEVGNTPEIQQRHETFILNVLGGRRITHFFSSEFYGEHMSRALGAQNCLVDPPRTTVPVSGTAVRNNPYAHRDQLSPLVYRDLITHVALLGAPSTGKTTLAEALAVEFRTVWMPEYGREFWEAHQVDRRLTLEQLVTLAQGHQEREEARLLEANQYLFTDTNALTTYQFSLYYHGRVHPQLAAYADACHTRYDLSFVCDCDIPYDDTWDRSGDANRQEFQQQIVADLHARGLPFTLLQGSVAERIANVKRILTTFTKYPPQ